MIKHVHRDLLCCEAIVRRMPNGELLLVCQCGDITEPAPNNRVYFWHSNDDGNNWSKKTSIVPEDGRAVYMTEVSVIGNEIRCYLTYHNGGFIDYENVVVSSTDNGHTWTSIGNIPSIEGFTFIRGLYTLEDGTELLPYQNYEVSREEEKMLLSSDKPKKIWDSKVEYVKNGVLISKDNGKTYTKSNSCDFPLHINNVPRWVWSEPTIVELSDGTISMLLRVDGEGYLYRSDSKDEGMNWSTPYKTDIPNPNNKPKLLKYKDKIALINTPNPTISFSSRNPLEIWISDDDMKTWQYKKTLIDFPGWISYPDGFIEKNTLYLSFEFNRHDIYFIKVDL